MATEAKLRQLADKGCPVYYFYSSERYLVRQAVAAAVRVPGRCEHAKALFPVRRIELPVFGQTMPGGERI